MSEIHKMYIHLIKSIYYRSLKMSLGHFQNFSFEFSRQNKAKILTIILV